MTTSTELAVVLRDFFSASAHYHLAAYSRKIAILLACISHEKNSAGVICMDEGTSWQAVEKDFFRLFVGPNALAPPYASVYLAPQCPIGNKGGPGACDIFYALGLGLSQEYAGISDHIALELDGWLTMNKLIVSTHGQHTQKANMEAAQRWLLCTHMQQWVPLFVHRGLGQHNITLPVRMALQALQLWLNMKVTGGCSPSQAA